MEIKFIIKLHLILQMITLVKLNKKNINEYLTLTGLTLTEIVMLPDDEYKSVREKIVPQNSNSNKLFFNTLDKCKTFFNYKNSDIMFFYIYFII